MDITGAIFDCDGTLVDSMGMWVHAYDWLYAHYGVPGAPMEVVEPLALSEACELFHNDYGMGSSAEEVYEIRVVLEVLATTKAAHNMTDEDFEEMRQLLEEGQRLNAANDVDGVVNNWDEFNQFIFAKANSPRLQSIIEPLQAYTRYFRNVSAKPELRRNQALEEHWGIYLAMRFGPEKKIEQVVRAHLNNSYNLVNGEMTTFGIE